MCTYTMSARNGTTDSREEGGGSLHQTPKQMFMKKFFNEPVDALDLRLAKAEENLSTLPADPFTDIRHEVKETFKKLLRKQIFCTFPD